MEGLYFVCLIILSAVSICTVDCCMCDFSSRPDKVCMADFVVKAKILREDLDFGEYGDFPMLKNYTVLYKKKDIFKGSHLLGSGNTAVIQTSGTPWNCGTTFELNKRYLISGFESGGEFFTNLCQWNPEYNTLLSKKRREIRNMCRDQSGPEKATKVV
ncbi:metalloproteinase inhibitor 3-like [Saccostrea echinata]|uniref:metalloproteinase inhibitor 3-like n=1 Tax=Saccostrea echinata TaxID=191078 RepID=UPI002A7FBAE5|nr:metalloproteinase inhibitor 3-like [Saccostrea echinata]